MDHLDTAYKLGSAKAMEQFTSWMDEDSDEKAASAMERLAEKLGGRRKKKKPTPRKRSKGQSAARAPARKGTGFKALKAKLRKKKSMSKKSGILQPEQPRARDVIRGRGPEAREARERLRKKLQESCPLNTAEVKEGEAPAWQRLNDQILGKGTGTSGATQSLKQKAPTGRAPAPAPAPAQPTQPTQPAPRPVGGNLASNSILSATINKAKAPLPSQPVAPVGGIGGGSRAARQVSQYTNIR